jgi:hypothetical protein
MGNQAVPRPLTDAGQGAWPAIIREVKTVPGLSALTVLVAGAIIGPFVYGTHEDTRKTLLWTTVGFLAFVLVANLIYFLRNELGEITFRVRVAKSTKSGDEPWVGATVQLYRNKDLVGETHTADEGDAIFQVKVGRKDELYVVVLDPETKIAKSQPAAVFSAGNCLMVKTIRLAEPR